MIDFENLEEFTRQLDRFVNEVESDWGEKHQSFAFKVFYQILETSPQWSGNFTANWVLSIGSPEFRYSEYSSIGDGSPVFRGDYQAVGEALSRNSSAINYVVAPHMEYFITNSTPYGDVIAANNDPLRGAGTSHLRPLNYFDPTPIPLGHVMLEADKLWDEVIT